MKSQVDLTFFLNEMGMKTVINKLFKSLEIKLQQKFKSKTRQTNMRELLSDQDTLYHIMAI